MSPFIWVHSYESIHMGPFIYVHSFVSIHMVPFIWVHSYGSIHVGPFIWVHSYGSIHMGRMICQIFLFSISDALPIANNLMTRLVESIWRNTTVSMLCIAGLM